MASSTSTFFDTELLIGKSTVVITNNVIGNSDNPDNEVKVYAGRCDGENVAVKVWPSSDNANYAESEFHFLKICQSPYVLKAFTYKCGLLSPGLHSLLVTELMDIPLESLLDQENLTELMLLQIALSIAQALKKVHVEGVIHRDIKPGNILLRMQDSKEITEVKLADFGSATKAINNEMWGTVDFIAPEMLRGEQVTSQADIYSFGVTLLVMSHGFGILDKNEKLSKAVAGLQSFQLKNRNNANIHASEEYKAIANAVLQNREFSSLMAASECKVERSPEYMKLICQCMDSDPTARCSIDMIISQLYKMMNRPGYAVTLAGSYSFSLSSTTEMPLIRHDSIELTLTDSGMESIESDDDNAPLPPYLIEQMTGPIPPMPAAPRGYTCISPQSSLRAYSLYSAASSSQEEDLCTSTTSFTVPAKK